MANSVPNYVSNDDLAEILPVYADNIKAIENVYGSKNLLKNLAYTRTINGVTFTVNADGSINVNGTASADINFIVCSVGAWHANPLCILSGCPASGSSSTYYLRLIRPGVVSRNDTGSGVLLDVDIVKDGVVRIDVLNGTTVNNALFKPMIRDARIKDSTYVPYAPTNKELATWAANSVLGAKNLLKVSATSKKANGVTFTVYDDGSVLVDTGGSAASNTTDMVLNYGLQIPGECIMTGCPSGGSGSTFRLMYTSWGGQGIEYADTGTGVNIKNIPIESNPNVRVVLRVSNGATVSNKLFKPMIRLADDTDTTYQPHAMTNKQLTDDKAEETPIYNLYGSKNLIKNTAYGKTENNVSFTVRDDGSVRASTGENQSSARAMLTICSQVKLPAGNYYLTGAPSNADRTKYSLFVARTRNGNVSYITNDKDENPAYVDIIDGDIINVVVDVRSGQTLDEVFYPMIRDSRIKDNTFVPYVPINKDLMSWKFNSYFGVHNILPKSEGTYFSKLGTGTELTYTDGNHAFDITCPASSSSDAHGVYQGGSQVKSIAQKLFDNYPPMKVSFYYKASAAVLGRVCVEKPGGTNDITLPTTWTKFEDTTYINPTNGNYYPPVIYNYSNTAITINVKDFCYSIVEDTDNTYRSYALTNRQLTELSTKLAPLSYSVGKELTSGDLNNIKTPGMYVYTLASAANITNRPTGYTGAAVMYVIEEWSNYLRQILMLRDAASIATRVYMGQNGWSHWCGIDLTDLGA